MNQKESEFFRLKNILISDKANNPDRLSEVLKSEIMNVANQYVCVDPLTCVVNVNSGNDSYDIQILMKACKNSQ